MFTIIVRTADSLRQVLDNLTDRRHDAKLIDGGRAVLIRVFD